MLQLVAETLGLVSFSCRVNNKIFLILTMSKICWPPLRCYSNVGGSITTSIANNVSLDDFNEVGPPSGWFLTPLPWFLIVVNNNAGFLCWPLALGAITPRRGEVSNQSMIHWMPTKERITVTVNIKRDIQGLEFEMSRITDALWKCCKEDVNNALAPSSVKSSQFE